MRKRKSSATLSSELVTAIGLIWGHLNARQFEEAYLLAKGCLAVWPDERNITLMYAYAAAEVLEPVDLKKIEALRDASTDSWIRVIQRRLQNQLAH